METPRVVRIEDAGDKVYYEYIRPPCVYPSFYPNGKKICGSNGAHICMCADPLDSEAAVTACCITSQLHACSEGAYYASCAGEDTRFSGVSKFEGERMSFAKAQARCQGLSGTYPLVTGTGYGVSQGGGGMAATADHHPPPHT